MADEETNRQTRDELVRILGAVSRQLQSDNVDENVIDNVLHRLDWIHSTVIRYADLEIVDQRVVNCIRSAMEELLRSINYYNATNFASAITNRVFTGERGRPRLQIQFEQLQLLEKNFKVAEIANLFGTSKRTVERRMNDFGLSARDSYSTLTDQELDELITVIQRDFPNAGSKRMTGLLRARDVNVQQTRIRQSMRRVDPEGTLLRALEMKTICRRKYSVAGPLSLWHIDGNHKLIRFVTSFVSCSNNWGGGKYHKFDFCPMKMLSIT